MCRWSTRRLSRRGSRSSGPPDVEGGRDVATAAIRTCPTFPITASSGRVNPTSTIASQHSRFEVVNQQDPQPFRAACASVPWVHPGTQGQDDGPHADAEGGEIRRASSDRQHRLHAPGGHHDLAGELIIVSGLDARSSTSVDGYNKFQQVHTEKGPRARRAGPQAVICRYRPCVRAKTTSRSSRRASTRTTPGPPPRG